MRRSAVCNKYTATDVRSHHTPPQLLFISRPFEQQPTAIRAELNSANQWPTRLNQFSFSILNLQNIVKILTAVINCIFNPPYRLEIFMLQIPPISKIFQSPFLPQKTKFYFYEEIAFLDKDYIWAINDRTKKCYIIISIAHWFFTINYHYIY